MIGTKRWYLPCYVALMYGFLYIPIVVLVFYSFNSVAFPYRWVSFSLRWYYQLLNTPEIWRSLANSLLVATATVFLSLALGVLIAFYSMESRLRVVLSKLFYINLLIPEIVIAVGLLSFFYFFSIPLGLIALITGHTLLGLGYAVPLIYTSLSQVDLSIIEASLDLGATIHQTFYRIILPLLMPSMVAAGLLIFIISLDDFVISFFCSGATAQTLPVYIFAMIRSGVSPTINALSSVLLVFTTLLVLVLNALQKRVL